MIKKHGDNIVLIIEDDADIRTFACRVIELEGYICLQAKTGDEAAKLIRGNKVNLVLLDLRLTGDDGLNILEQLKSDAATAPIPVIVFTASLDEQQRESALKMGVTDYLIKPLSANVLKGAVARVLPLE